jgi:hypothetical protein
MRGWAMICGGILVACHSGSAPGDAPGAARSESGAPATSASASPTVLAGSRDAGPPSDASLPSLAEAVDARIAQARGLFGADVPVAVVAGVFVLVSVEPGALANQAAAFTRQTVAAFLHGRFGGPPKQPVSVFLFSTRDRFVAFVKSRYHRSDADDLYGLSVRPLKEIAVDGSAGVKSSGTLAHELTHSFLDSDGEGLPLWFQECVAEVYDDPSFPAPGEITGLPWSIRLGPFVHALGGHGREAPPRLGVLFAMTNAEFNARLPDGGSDEELHELHASYARYACVWLDSRGWLWPLYHAWRDSRPNDPLGEAAFLAVTGMAADSDAATAAWLAWARKALPGAR